MRFEYVLVREYEETGVLWAESEEEAVEMVHQGETWPEKATPCGDVVFVELKEVPE